MAKKEFSEVWERVRSETNLKKIIDLAKFVGTSQPNVSKKKKENNFPIEWAYEIAKKNRLSIEWILEGNGPKRTEQCSENPEIIKQIVTWIQEQEKKEPGALAWFKYDFRKKYPEFDRWEKREEGDSVESDAAAKSNIV